MAGSPHRRIAPVGVLLAALLVCARAPEAQQLRVTVPPQTPPPPPQATFRAGTILVPIDVRVLDSKGRPVTDLTRDDFTVFEDDIRQDVALFSATAVSPVVPNLMSPLDTDPTAVTDPSAPKFVMIRGNGAAPNPFLGMPAAFVVNDVSKAPVMNLANPMPPAAMLRPDALTMPEAIVGQPVGRTAAEMTGAGTPMGALSQSVAETDATVEKLNIAIDQLKHDEGEKHIVLVATTPPTFERAEDVDALARLANDARVVIDVVQDAACGCWGVADMERLASLTGGVAGIYAKPRDVQARIEAANSFEYHLGYYPKDPVLDERYRQIVVKANRPGLALSHRTGYYARKPPLVLSPADRKKYDRVSAALRRSMPMVDLKVTATAHGYKHGDTRGVLVHVVVASDGIQLTQLNGVHTGSIDVVVLAANARSQLVGRQWDTVDLKMSAAEHDRFLATGLAVDQDVRLTAAASYVKVVIYDPASDRTGSVMIPVK